MELKPKKWLSMRVLLGSPLLIAVCFSAAACGHSQSEFSASSPDPEATVTYREASWVVDPNDKEALAQWADEIFTGTVLSTTGAESEDPDFPTTQYQIQVREVIDGAPSVEVSAVQDGGYTDDGRDLILFTGDHLLESGTTHLFVAKVHEGQRHLFPVVGSQELETASQERALAQEYKAAVEDAASVDAKR